MVSPANLEAVWTAASARSVVPAPPRATRTNIRPSAYRDPGGRRVVETWLVRGMRHAWSGGDPGGTHTYLPGPPATERMLDFLLAAP